MLSYKSTSKPLNSLRKKVSNSNLFGFVQSFASSGNLFSLLKERINHNNSKNNNNNDNNLQQQNKNMISQKEISSLSMFASNGISNYNNNDKIKNGKISPTSITFTNEELEDISNLNNKLTAYNYSPAHEFEILTSGVCDSTKSCKVVGFLEIDPLQAASATHKKNSNSNKKNFFNLTK